MSELQNAIQEVHSAFAEFKEANDARLAAIEKGQQPDPVQVERVEKANAAVSELTEKVKALQDNQYRIEADLQRPALADVKDRKKMREEATQFFAHARHQFTPATDDQVEAYKAYASALNAYFRKGEAITPDIRNALSVGSDPDGGFYVTPAMSSTIGEFVYETSPMRSVAGVESIGTDSLEGFNDLDEATSGGWVGETASRSDTDTPQVGMWRIPVHEQYAQPKATQKMLDDSSIDIENWLARKIADKLSRDENTAFVTGNGTARPRGFTTYTAGTPTATNYEVIQQLTTGVSGGFNASDPGDDLIDMVFSVKNAYRTGAVWAMTRLTLAEVRKMQDGQGNYLWQPNFTQERNGLLVGYPIVEMEDMAEIAADSLSVAFGNFRLGYKIVDRQGIRVLRDPFTDKPNVRFYTTKRVGGAIVNFEAIKLLKFGS